MIKNIDWRGCYKNFPGAGNVATIDCIDVAFNNVLNTAFVLAGALALILILISALRFVTSRGDATAIDNAKKMFLYSLIGLVIILLSFAIVNFVLRIAFGQEVANIRSLTNPDRAY